MHLPENAHSFRLKPELNQLDVLHRQLEDYGLVHELNPSIVFELNLALDELVTNIIVHGRKSGGGDIQVHLVPHAEETEVVLVDDGPAFDPNQAPRPDTACDLAQRCVGGLGIHLVKKLTNSLRYEYTDGQNITTLRKSNTSRCGK